ncbi:MAG: ATP-binding protein [Saprospiraceae bacterium]
MSNHQLSKYSAKIKDVYIELKDYQFFHSPYDKKGHKRFIGRNKAKKRIQSILKNAKTKSGSYLITGFRGMGKTSIIREAISSYNLKLKDENNKWWENPLVHKPNLRFIKRFLGYTFGLILIDLFSKNYCNCPFKPYSIVLVFALLHAAFVFLDYSKNEEGDNKCPEHQIWVKIILTIILFGFVSNPTIQSTWFFGIYSCFLIFNCTALYISEKISTAA